MGSDKHQRGGSYSDIVMTASTDPSTRFILPGDAPYLKNLAALWSIDPALAADIENDPSHSPHPNDFPSPRQPDGQCAPPSNAADLPAPWLGDAALGQTAYELQTARNGEQTLLATTAQGRQLHLHSRYDPTAEAERLVEEVDAAHTLAFYIHGFGLGYHVEALYRRASEEAIFVIFEPDLSLLRMAFHSRDLSPLIESKRLIFFTHADKGELLNRLSPSAALISLGSATVVHPPSQQIASAFHDQMRVWIEEFGSYTQTSVNTVLLNSQRTAENVARNIGWYAASPSLDRLKGRHQGKPAVVVSAGPSLRKNKHLLKDLQGRAILIAVQTTLQPLLEMGIEPDYVTSLDYHDICTRFFEKLPKTLKTELVAEPKANNRILSMYPGPVSLLGNGFAEGLVREMRLAKTRLRDGATVAHLAYYLAEHLGCDPVIFVGQDLGFSDGLIYTPGTSYEDVWRPEQGRFCTVEMKQWEQIVRERFLLRKIPDQEGRPMYTEERMFTYLQQFERDFLSTRTVVIDATEGGAAKRGTTVMPLARAAAEFCTSLLPAEDGAEHPGMQWRRQGQVADCLKRRREEGREIERIARETLPLLEEIRDNLSDQPRVNRAIGAIDALRGQMNDLGATYDLVTQFCQQSEMKRFEADRKIAAAKLTPTEKQRQQVLRDIDNVRQIIAASIEFSGLMDEVTDRLAATTPAPASAPVSPAASRTFDGSLSRIEAGSVAA